MTVQAASISSTFIWRRVHSLMGFWLFLYLVLHLLTNSQAALWIGDDGSGFVKMVNSLESMPYLQVVETVLIGIPLVIHGVWGIKRALSAKLNAHGNDGKSPSLPYSRNRAFSLQRITSWILLVGIIGHVVQMRFLDAPKEAKGYFGEQYFTKISFDEGLYTLAPRLGVKILSAEDVAGALDSLQSIQSVPEERQGDSDLYDPEVGEERISAQEIMQDRAFLEVLTSFCLKENQVIAVSDMPGTAFLLMVRDTFKSPFMAVLYTIFLLAATFHACNGFWTFLIAWGAILSYRSQKAFLPISMIGMIILSFLGLAAIWCSYWVNLRY